MKKDIHPAYYPKSRVQCACGNSFTVGSTKELIEVEICSKCHPFYSGKAKIIDTMGRVEKFRKRLAKKTDAKGKKFDNGYCSVSSIPASKNYRQIAAICTADGMKIGPSNVRNVLLSAMKKIAAPLCS